MKRGIFALLLPLLLAAGAARGDQVFMKNGDRLTGTIVKTEGGVLLLKTDYASEIKLSWAKVESVNAPGWFHVEWKDGRKANGKLKAEGGTVSVVSDSPELVARPKEQVTVIRSRSEQISYDRIQNPRFLDGWNNRVLAGFSLARGNNSSKTLNFALNTTRTTLHNKLSLYQNSVFTTNDAPGAVPQVAADIKTGGMRFDMDVVRNYFGYVAADFAANALQDLDLRSVYGSGLGVHAVKTETFTFNLLGGANFTREEFATFTRRFAAASIGQELTQKVQKQATITENFFVYPDLESTGEYRMALNIGTLTRINRWLGWQNTFNGNYITNPPPGKVRQDVLFSTGLSFTLGH